MPHGVIVLLTDRPDHSRPLATAIEAINDCIVVDLRVVWSRLEGVGGVVVDVAIASPDAKRCLLSLQSSFRAIGHPPLVLLTRSNGDAERRAAKALGLSACIPARSDHRTIVGYLLEQVCPDASLTDTVVARSVERVGSVLNTMLDGARTRGRIDQAAVADGIEHILGATREGGLERWLEIVWRYDDSTFQHCLIVAGLTAYFAAGLGLSSADQRLMTRGALLHDIGKAQIPLAILNKPGELDPNERAVMRRHAVLGHDILTASGERDAVILGITRHHHELLDGTGYPDGLSGDAISDPIRILTICDIYAALIERRSYKPAIPSAQALKILFGMSGKIERALIEAFAATLPAHEKAP